MTYVALALLGVAFLAFAVYATISLWWLWLAIFLIWFVCAAFVNLWPWMIGIAIILFLIYCLNDNSTTNTAEEDPYAGWY